MLVDPEDLASRVDAFARERGHVAALPFGELAQTSFFNSIASAMERARIDAGLPAIAAAFDSMIVSASLPHPARALLVSSFTSAAR